MGSVSSASSVLSSLLQTLSSESPTLSSLLSAPNVQSALQKDSPADIVQLSDQAVKMQEANLLFGTTEQPQTSPSASDSILQLLQSQSESASATASTQAQNLAALFNPAPTADPLLNTLL